MNTLILVINYKCECSVTEDESQHHKLTSLTVQWILKNMYYYMYILLYVFELHALLGLTINDVALSFFPWGWPGTVQSGVDLSSWHI